MSISKDEKYQAEQADIINKLYDILDLQENSITLHELDTNKNKQQQIIDLFPEIQKYFSISYAIPHPDRIKRLYLSIIKQILKRRYHIFSKEVRIDIDELKIRTKRYTFIPL